MLKVGAERLGKLTAQKSNLKFKVFGSMCTVFCNERQVELPMQNVCIWEVVESRVFLSNFYQVYSLHTFDSFIGLFSVLDWIWSRESMLLTKEVTANSRVTWDSSRASTNNSTLIVTLLGIMTNLRPLKMEASKQKYRQFCHSTFRSGPQISLTESTKVNVV